MTDSNYTHLLTIVDRSGSMFGIAGDMRGALDQFFKSQSETEGKCLVDYVQFDQTFERVFEDRPVGYAKAVLDPRGSTALLDAIGKAVTDLGAKFARMKEENRPSTVIVAVITDGMENASREWTAENVKNLIKQQEDEYNWEFTFLGANMDAVAVGAQFGFDPGKSLTYDVHNTDATMASLSAHTHRIRGGMASSYSSDERAAAVGDNS